VPFFKPMEIFTQEVSHAVMTAILINDLRNKKAVANPDTPLRNPLELFSSAGFHGCVRVSSQRWLSNARDVVLSRSGVWRMAYKFGSVGEIAVLVHFVKVGAPYVLGLLVLLLALRRFVW
jgi:hypothetical protein